MSHHFAQMCACSFFLVRAVHCSDAGSCSLIVSHDRLQSFLDKVLRGEAIYGRWHGNNLVTRQKAIYGGVRGTNVVTAVLDVAFILVHTTTSCNTTTTVLVHTMWSVLSA